MTETVAETTTDLRGYQTNVTLVQPKIRQPCPRHEREGWLSEAVHASEHGWPPGHPGGPWQATCPDCQATPPLLLDERVVDWTSNDPRVIGVTETGAAILEPNPLRRAWRKLTHRRQHGEP